MLVVPQVDSAFYPSLLGAVLSGIGIALLLERFKRGMPIVGLGLAGAIAINLCGASVLAAWLVGGHLDIPGHGYAFLWGPAILLVGIRVVEGPVYFRNTRAPD
ncbi:MAG: hypothetical protein M5R40_26215 [Anaerolineae bacterium]|nr:hypothetical protein [Anaerolineae bacterium]